MQTTNGATTKWFQLIKGIQKIREVIEKGIGKVAGFISKIIKPIFDFVRKLIIKIKAVAGRVISKVKGGVGKLKEKGQDLLGGERRGLPGFSEPLDFLVEGTHHIPNKGEHQIRYYGFYSNKKRGMQEKKNPGM